MARSEGMRNGERTNIVPAILLEILCSGLPNELFKLNEKENSKKKKREREKEKEGRRGEFHGTEAKRGREKEIRTSKGRTPCS